MLNLRSLCSLTLTLATLAPNGEDPTLEQRLAKLSDDLEIARQEAHVPGMSIAIVRDDEIIFARGFGFADVEEERPADEETIYAIGSTTKAFTATLLGMLVDEGKASWDDPVTRYLPYFDLPVRSDDASAECTLRDLLSHRHGFARMGMLWIGGGVSREEILRTATGAEPFDDFRAGFHYCNVTYLAAGVAAGAADETTWDELMVERIFEPLEMTSSSLSVSVAEQDPRFAIGYRWDEVDEAYKRERLANIDAIGPAGSVNSNVLDMAQWLRLQLGKGEVDDMRLVTPERILETWTPEIGIGGGSSYGLGWMLHQRDGRKLVEHGGNINGYSAQIGMIPELDLGYVLLMNVSVSPLQQASLPFVFDALLKEWPAEEPGVAPGDAPGQLSQAPDYDRYAGVYVANFANFRDEEFEIRAGEKGLELDIPSQQTFELKDPNEEGEWVFVLTDQVAVTFDTNAAGEVLGLVMNQGGFRFEVPRQGVEQEPEVPAEELERYVGTYERANGGKHIKFSIERGRLHMEDKGRLMPFHAPDADGLARMRARTEFTARFRTDAEGRVESLVFHGEAGDQLFTRLADEGAADLPTLAEVLALRGTEARSTARDTAGGTRATGEVWIAQAGIRGKLTVYSQGGDRYANHTDYGKFGRTDIVAAGAEAWSYDPMRGFRSLNGDELTQAILGHPDAVEGDWRDYFDSVEVVRNDTLEDRLVHVVRLKRGEFPSRTYSVDAETGDVLRIEQIYVEGSVRVPVTTTYSDFQEIDGIRTPMRIVAENPMSGRSVMTLSDMESGLELGAEVFQLTAPGATQPAQD